MLQNYDQSQGIGAGTQSIYKLRVLRRDSALDQFPEQSLDYALKIYNDQLCLLQFFLTKTLLFLIALETRDHLLELEMAICFDRRYDKDFSMEIAISLASAKCLTTLQLS